MRRAPSLFCEESFGKMPSFSGTVGPRILSLESVDYFGRSEHLSGPKKKENLYEQSFDGEANNNKQIAMLERFSLDCRKGLVLVLFLVLLRPLVG